MDLASIRRLGAAALGGLALLAPVATTIGCAQTREVARTMTSPVGTEDEEERAYDRGHRKGRSAAQRELAADYSAYAKEYDAATEKAFALGFRDGYAGRANRYGSTNTRDWFYDRARNPDDR